MKALRAFSSPFQNIYGLIVNTPFSPEIRFRSFKALRLLVILPVLISKSLEICTLMSAGSNTLPVLNSALLHIQISKSFALADFS